MAPFKNCASARKLSLGLFSHPVFIIKELTAPHEIQPEENSTGGVLEDNIHNN